MQGFLESFKPILHRYTGEIILLGCALLIACISGLLYFTQTKKDQISPSPIKNVKEDMAPTNHSITVDVSGAVQHPFVYTFTGNARLIDAIQRSGGTTQDADEAFIRRNINFARLLSDQEKIYIPFLSDTANGFVLENKHVIDYTQPNINSSSTPKSRLININEASLTELDQLPGIGKVQSEAILNARPYITTEDLVKNEVIKQSVYDKIKDQISVY